MCDKEMSKRIADNAKSIHDVDWKDKKVWLSVTFFSFVLFSLSNIASNIIEPTAEIYIVKIALPVPDQLASFFATTAFFLFPVCLFLRKVSAKNDAIQFVYYIRKHDLDNIKFRDLFLYSVLLTFCILILELFLREVLLNNIGEVAFIYYILSFALLKDIPLALMRRQ